MKANRLSFRVLLLTLSCTAVLFADAPAKSDKPDKPAAQKPADNKNARNNKDDDDKDRDLSDERIELVLAVVNDVHPMMAQRLNVLRDSDPKQFRRNILQINSKMAGLIRLRQEDPDAYKSAAADKRYQRETWELSRRIKSADGDEARRLTDDLRKMLHEQFQVKLDSRQSEITNLQTRLDGLRKQIQQQQNQKDALIGKRFDELLAKPGADIFASPNPPEKIIIPDPPGKIDPPADPPHLTDEQIDQIMDIIRLHRPTLADELAALRQRDPKAFRATIATYAPRLRYLVLKRRVDPQGFDLQTREQQLQTQAGDLAKQVNKDGGKTKDLKKSLRSVIEQQFDARQQMLGHELNRLESRITQLSKDLADQRTREDKFVDERMQNLLGDSK
ncbi:MAG: hypothetical protein GC162_11085 [Planctomycetes bacterium]|nr:hypothetical protein [Planctomycetota bacterium]